MGGRAVFSHQWVLPTRTSIDFSKFEKSALTTDLLPQKQLSAVLPRGAQLKEASVFFASLNDLLGWATCSLQHQKNGRFTVAENDRLPNAFLTTHIRNIEMERVDSGERETVNVRARVYLVC